MTEKAKTNGCDDASIALAAVGILALQCSHGDQREAKARVLIALATALTGEADRVEKDATVVTRMLADVRSTAQGHEPQNCPCPNCKQYIAFGLEHGQEMAAAQRLSTRQHSH